MTRFLTPHAHSTTDRFPNLPEGCCISLIGMAGAGKSTVGRRLARELDWAYVDTDFLIESVYGAPLQDIADRTTKEEFLDLEAQVVGNVRLSRAVLATGGSVVYRESGMAHLKSLGPIVHLDVSFPIIEERIARNPDRGLAIAPGQTIEDLFRERETLYRHYATFSLDACGLNPAECATAIMDRLAAL